jgi:hypothetical protein
MDAQLKHEIMLRDQFVCLYCGYDAKVSFEAWLHGNLSVDHFIPPDKGGTDDPTNLKTACRACNSSKARRVFESMESARRWLRLYRDEFYRRYYQEYVLGRKPKPRPYSWDQFNKRLAEENASSELPMSSKLIPNATNVFNSTATTPVDPT